MRAVLLVMGYLEVRDADIQRLRAPIQRQMNIVREFFGCEHYAFGVDILEPSVLRISERWRSRAMQAAHLVGDHMVEFNIGMRAAHVVATHIDCYENGVLRRLMQIPATSFRPEREEKEMVVVMGSIKLAPGEIERLMPELTALVKASRTQTGCDHYACARDVLDPDVIHLSAMWRGQVTLTAQMSAPHVAAFNAALADAKLDHALVKAYDMSGERTLLDR